MRYIFFVLLFVSSAVFGGTSIDKKIHKTSSQLHSYKRNYVNINKKLKETAQEILRQKRELKKQIIYLQKLKAELTTKESSYDENIAQLKLLRKSQDALKEKQEKIEERLVFFIAKSVSLSVVLEEKYAENEESLMQVEILKTMLKSSQDEVKKLNSVFYENEKKVKLLRSHANTLQSSITQIDSKRKKLVKITKAKQTSPCKTAKREGSLYASIKKGHKKTERS